MREIATVDVSPEEIAAFFEQPSYEAAQAGGKHLPGATATLLESNPRHIHVLDGFLQQPQAAQLRGVFDERFSKPREGTAERFVWDWWHVPEQYTLMRTPAEEYFGPEYTLMRTPAEEYFGPEYTLMRTPAEEYFGPEYTLMRTPAEEYFGPEGFEALTAALCKFGQEQLGCRAISPPWLSVYIDGCEQRFHTDAWHGPWAFVLSLTDWDGKDFTGGETQILKPHVLNYWNSFAPGIGLEEKHFLDTIEPHFNRLTLFDPRFPHGVKPVRGTRDPRKGRLVLHGWFTDPQPYFSGGLSEEEATEALNRAMEASGPALAAAEGGRVTGTLTVRLHVSGADGSVRAVSALTDTLVADPTDLAYDEEGDPIDARAEAMLIIHEALGGADFPCSASGEDTFITVPYAFE
ncbi:hypothetical protein JKP88DRAFT_348815 [Tribonema minus]|uniref:Prolyl 4-hydroxylase alpha subunit Fe(2+) 2OG dioxygenase domain-containing protein n=1 Tax=Tribonema minus TaxID=303371 RepID=A0A835Z5I9_9STRA|nr:hypothetical protein JKP88DRAFT_348815 [Tribonema minus]